MISTAGEPGSEFEEEREDIRQTSEVLERGRRSCAPGALSGCCTTGACRADGDVEDFELVARANPFSGITPATLERKFERLGKAGQTLQHWRRLTCNLPTRSNAAAIQEAEWFARGHDERIPAGEPVWVAWTWRGSGIAPQPCRCGARREYRLLGHASILTPPRDGTSLDPNEVERALIEIHARNPVHTVVMDTCRAEQLAEWISQELGATVIDRPQTNKEAAID